MAGHDSDVIVIGGGLTGLAAAFDLTLRGLAVEVIEADAQPGGVIRSRRVALPDGEVLVEAGPNSATDSDPAVGALIDALDLAAQRVDVAVPAQRRYLLRAGRLQAAPAGPLSFIATPLFSARAKWALLTEPFVPPRPAAAADVDESVASFITRRLGREWLDYAVEPLLGGIYAGDPARMSMAATLPQLARWEAQHGSLLRGALAQWWAQRRSGPRGVDRDTHPDSHTQTDTPGSTQARARSTSFSFRAGLQTLTDALARQLPRVLCAARVDRLQREGDRFTVNVERQGERFTRRARAVLLAVPAHEAARLAAPLGAAGAVAAAALAQIEAPPVATVSVALARAQIAHPLDGFGFLAPRVEQSAVLGTLFASTMFAGRAPADMALLTSFVGGRRDAPAALAPDAQLIERVCASHAQLLGMRGAPLATLVQRWPRAIPQTDLGHHERLAAVDALEAALPGVTWAGAWRDGASIAQCIAGARTRAARVAAQVPATRLPARVRSARPCAALLDGQITPV